MTTYVANVFESSDALPTPVEFFTYGSPKVFDRSACLPPGKFKTRHTRFVNCNDVVAHVPMLGFEHYTAASHISCSNTLPIYHQGGEGGDRYSFVQILDMLAARWRDWMQGVAVPGAADHSMGNYIRKIERLNEGRLVKMGRCKNSGKPIRELAEDGAESRGVVVRVHGEGAPAATEMDDGEGI